MAHTKVNAILRLGTCAPYLLEEKKCYSFNNKKLDIPSLSCPAFCPYARDVLFLLFFFKFKHLFILSLLYQRNLGLLKISWQKCHGLFRLSHQMLQCITSILRQLSQLLSKINRSWRQADCGIFSDRICCG